MSHPDRLVKLLESAALKAREELAAGKVDLNGAFAMVEDIADAEIEAQIEDTQHDHYEKIIEVIHYRRATLPLDTGATDKVIDISLQILSFGAAGLALALGFVENVAAFDPVVRRLIAALGVFYAELVVLSLILLLFFLLHARFRFPFLYFRKIGNAWPWFYYASISDEVPRSPLQSRYQLLKGGVLYASDFLGFSRKSFSETPRQRLRSEIQQYFLLISYQGYVNQFTLRQTNLFIYGLVACTATGLLLAALAIWDPSVLSR